MALAGAVSAAQATGGPRGRAICWLRRSAAWHPGNVLSQAEIWSALGGLGVLRDDPSTWRAPVVRIPCPESEAFAAAGTQPVLWEAFDQLIGEGRWWRRRGVGGTRSTCWTRRRVAQCLEQWSAWPGPHPGFMTRRRTLAGELLYACRRCRHLRRLAGLLDLLARRGHRCQV